MKEVFNIIYFVCEFLALIDHLEDLGLLTNIRFFFPLKIIPFVKHQLMYLCVFQSSGYIFVMLSRVKAIIVLLRIVCIQL